ncbi:F0F1 ATP synthase subunit delta [Candidatus Peregrinibacteria bacterium]|nr:F0F1 ATP synthase subunit delta [Candidatus Peregrinibacteria bacterium]
MRLTPKQYAIALYEMTKGASEKEASNAIKQFVKILIKNNVLSLLSKILRFYTDYYNHQEGVVDLKIQTIKHLPKVAKELEKLLGNGKVSVTEEIKPELLGGAIFQWKDQMIDGSLKSRLQKLEQVLIK